MGHGYQVYEPEIETGNTQQPAGTEINQNLGDYG